LRTAFGRRSGHHVTGTPAERPDQRLRAGFGRRSGHGVTRGPAGDSAGDYDPGAMTDQLSLRLETDLPRLPDRLRPMLPRPADAPFDSPEHLFEPSWGGLRALVYVGPAERPGAGDVRIVDVDGAEVGRNLPELAGLAVRVDARSAVLDGELVAVDARGRADPRELARRIGGGEGRPVAFLAFDLLHLDGRSLVGWPLDRRRRELRRVLRPGDEVVAVPAIVGDGRALWDAAAAQGIAGVMARVRTSPYLSGVRSRLWRFVPADVAAPDDPTEAAEGPANGPVLALISRLPLLEDDDTPREP
jgi:bifunctional non-homologous end joining protein LigD